jgi:hypothetical protein
MLMLWAEAKARITTPLSFFHSSVTGTVKTNRRLLRRSSPECGFCSIGDPTVLKDSSRGCNINSVLKRINVFDEIRSRASEEARCITEIPTLREVHGILNGL